MTREEAIFCEKSYIGETNCTDCKYYIADTCLSRESHKMAIKALEQVSILDKIRAEIADLADEPTYGDYQYGFSYGLMRAAQIIDKYKAGEEYEDN